LYIHFFNEYRRESNVLCVFSNQFLILIRLLKIFRLVIMSMNFLLYYDKLFFNLIFLKKKK